MDKVRQQRIYVELENIEDPQALSRILYFLLGVMWNDHANSFWAYLDELVGSE